MIAFLDIFYTCASIVVIASTILVGTECILRILKKLIEIAEKNES